MPKKQTTCLRSAERNSSNSVALTLRFNEKLRQQLADAANRSVRSMNSEIIFRLRTSFDHEAVA
jgi:predicted HicB family RNase H-like nuclease